MKELVLKFTCEFFCVNFVWKYTILNAIHALVSAAMPWPVLYKLLLLFPRESGF